jgi:hypothetical protein
MHRAAFVITTYGSVDETRKTLKFLEWVWSDEVTAELEKLGLVSLPQPMGLPFYDDKKGKGKAIIEAFSDLKNNHRKDGVFTENDICVYMDGNQIDYNHSLDMIRMIKEGISPFITTCRMDGMGVDDERGATERFENHLLSSRYGLPWLPDAQCGCWAFRGDFLEEMVSSFISNGFEIELELMNFFLNKSILPAYIGIKVGKPEKTSFLPEHSEPKLIRLSNWLEMNKDKIYMLAENFQKLHNVILPLKYISSFERLKLFEGKNFDTVESWKDWKGFPCLHKSSCINKERCLHYHPCNEKFNFRTRQEKLIGYDLSDKASQNQPF